MINQILKNMALATICFANTVFAGVEDWSGYFYLYNPAVGQSVIVHKPNGIVLEMGKTHISVGKTYSFSKGSCFNTICATADGALNKEMTVEAFLTEVQKLGGQLIGYSLDLGPTYTP